MNSEILATVKDVLQLKVSNVFMVLWYRRPILSFQQALANLDFSWLPAVIKILLL